jgi:tetratricopeptide (TPR) repeat protein
MVDTYRTREVADLLGITPARVRRFVRAGLLDAPRDSKGYQFSFQDLVLIRAATELEAEDLSPAHVGKALRELKRQLPGRPLSAVSVGSEAGRVVAREGESVWEPESGQFVLGLGDGVEARSRALGEERSLHLRAHGSGEQVAERSPADWFEIGCDLEAAFPEEARGAYGRALELAPDHPGAHLNLGRLLHEEGKLSAAEGHYRAALAAEPGSATAAFNLGVVLEDLGRVERAMEAYLRAIASSPELADAHYNLSRLYEATGDRSAALRHLRSYSLLSKTS